MIIINLTLTFDPSKCSDTSPEGYDPIADLNSIMEFGADYYNLTDWSISETSQNETETA